MNKACLISGLSRTIQFNIEKWIKIFGENTDYFIHITDSYIDQYNNTKTNYENILSKLRPVQVLHEKDINLKISKNINIKKQWYKFSIINSLKNYYEKINKIKYDVVIRIRPDVYLLDDKLEFQDIKDGIIYGNNDEFFYGSSNTINIISELIWSFDKIEPFTIRKTCFFYKFLEQNNINLKPINFNYKLVLTECNIIAVCGDSGSGKTSLVKHLNKLFDKPLKIEGDRYHKWERNDNNWNKYTHLNPEANFICKFVEDTFKLKIGENIYQVDYDHSNGKFTDKQEVISSNNILICGLHTLYDKKTNKLFNLKIFLETDKNLKYYWKLKRDILERGYSKEQVLKKIKEREEDNKKYIEPQKKDSDIIVNFFSDQFNYLDINYEPPIYLKIISKKNCLDFIKVLDDYNVIYELTKNDTLYIIIFHKIQKEFKLVLLHFIKKQNIDSYDSYYTIINAFLLYYNNT